MPATKDKKEAYHAWEARTGYKAPYRYCCIISIPGNHIQGLIRQSLDAIVAQEAQAFGVRLGSCYVCGNGIMNNHVIRDAEGRHFVIGCDCAGKLGSEMLTAAQKAEKLRQKAIKAKKAEERRIARDKAREVELDAQRELNGGPTDFEVKQIEEAELRESRRLRYTEENQWLIDVLVRWKTSNFCQDMARSLETNALVNQFPRAIEVMRDIYGKTHGRRCSKAYKAAVSEFEARLDGAIL